MPIDEEFDSGDVDALKEMVGSRGYELLNIRIEEELARRIRELEGELDQVRTGFVRGYISALRVVKQMPQILTTEIERQIQTTAEGEE